MKNKGPFNAPSVWSSPTEGDSSAPTTEPGLSITGRVDGEAYTVSAGARSLVISNPDGATLLTTVELPGGASISVTDPTTTTPSWTAPSGGATGTAATVLTTATKDGHIRRFCFSERVDAVASGPFSWQVEADFNFPDAVAQGPHTMGLSLIHI